MKGYEIKVGKTGVAGDIPLFIDLDDYGKISSQNIGELVKRAVNVLEERLKNGD